jgi:PhoPQ-activated pathogenicity-related protein
MEKPNKIVYFLIETKNMKKIPLKIQKKIGYQESFNSILQFHHWIHSYQIPLPDLNN